MMFRGPSTSVSHSLVVFRNFPGDFLTGPKSSSGQPSAPPGAGDGAGVWGLHVRLRDRPRRPAAPGRGGRREGDVLLPGDRGRNS